MHRPLAKCKHNSRVLLYADPPTAACTADGSATFVDVPGVVWPEAAELPPATGSTTSTSAGVTLADCLYACIDLEPEGCRSFTYNAGTTECSLRGPLAGTPSDGDGATGMVTYVRTSP